MPYVRPEGSVRPVTAATLRLDRKNEITLIQFRRDEPQPAPTTDKLVRSLGAAFARGLSGSDLETESIGRSTADGVPGIIVTARPLDPRPGFEGTRDDYPAYVRDRALYVVHCGYTPPRDEELLDACKELVDSLRLRPYRLKGNATSEQTIPAAKFIRRADAACREATREGFAGLRAPRYDRVEATAAELRRLRPFLTDFLAATLDLESRLAALPHPAGREDEWRRALRLEAGVLVPTARSALKAAQRGNGRRASSKLNGLGVVVGDLKKLFADVGLRVCSS